MYENFQCRGRCCFIGKVFNGVLKSDPIIAVLGRCDWETAAAAILRGFWVQCVHGHEIDGGKKVIVVWYNAVTACV